MSSIYWVSSQNKLETQYASKREAHHSEVTDLKQQLEMKSNEVRSLNASIDSLKSVNEELKVGFGRVVADT
jgi:kinesin family protein 5